MSGVRGSKSRPLWTCPKCGAKFVTRNQWHSCGRATLAEWTSRMTPHVRRIYDAFEQAVAACGEYHVAPAKTRIAFLGRVRFAGVSAMTPTSLTISFSLPSALQSKRILRIEEVVPGWFIHRLVITDAAQFDGQLTGWIRRAYALMGMQGRLQRRAKPAATRARGG